MNLIFSKIKEVSYSVLPIVGLVLLLNFWIPVGNVIIFRFIIGAILVILGLTSFLTGVEIGITPLGELTGATITKSNKLSIVFISGIILGFFISIAEPGLMVLANQISEITNNGTSNFIILIVVSIGLSILLSFGFVRIFYSFALYKLLIILYGFIFLLSLFTTKEFLAISFDASGATTGILSVPFILSLSSGISKLKKDSKGSEKDSFGLVAIASCGAIIAVMLLDIFTPNPSFADVSLNDIDLTQKLKIFINFIPTSLKESLIAISPLLIILLLLQKFFLKIHKREFRKLITGFLFTFLGLFIFLIGVNAGFMDVGIIIGKNLIEFDNKFIIIGVGFIIGVLTIIAEPAVHVLTYQIESVTSGYVKRKAVLIALTIGVGCAISISLIRILNPSIELWHFLLPGYIISIILMFFTPKLFVGIAFDAGGVATGPMTATFILAFIQGAADKYEYANLMKDGFGMISMVAMTPIITLQILGLIFSIKSKGDKK